MNKLAGICAILLAMIIYLENERKDGKNREALIQDFLDAIESMETAVRWENAAFPEILQAQTERIYAGEYFEKISAGLKNGTVLQALWNSEFSKLSCRELARILCAVSFCGDSEFLQKRLAYTAAELRELQKKDRAEERVKRKLKITAVLSGAGMIIILLL